MLKMKFQILWPPDVKSQLIGKGPDVGTIEDKRRSGTEDEMVRKHH